VGSRVSLRQLRFAERHVEGVERHAARGDAPYHDQVPTSLLLSLLALLANQDRQGRPTWYPGEFESMVAHLVAGCAVAIAVFRLVPRVPWPRPIGWRFIVFHLVAAPAAAALWFLLSLGLEPLVGGVSALTLAERWEERMVVGSLFYVVIAGLSYSSHGAARAAQAEAVAAKTQLATLRSQLQPHFLFNALHTIVQLIHVDRRRATEAAESVADLLRRTLEEERDEVPLRDEWRFVSRYLAIEQMRFGERLVLNATIPTELESEPVPSFALQTLVENAVQHGAAPRVGATDIAITATRNDGELVLSVRNTGDRDASRAVGNGTGTGLARLRERLAVLYGGAATLAAGPIAAGGYEAILTVPRKR
jgi:signal transduction histidine kinase